MDLSSRTPASALADHLQDRIVLLVLDNFERVLAAASLVGQGRMVFFTARIVEAPAAAMAAMAASGCAPQLSATLTAREIEVLRHVAAGQTNRQIAAELV